MKSDFGRAISIVGVVTVCPAVTILEIYQLFVNNPEFCANRNPPDKKK
jgi:hypothetical protein